MEPIVKEFLESRRSAERQKFEKERDELLMSLGLVENVKEYSPNGAKTPGYVKLDAETNKYYRVKKVPVTVTDEEFEEIRKVTAKPVAQNKSQNKSIPDGTEWGLKHVNGIFWLLAIGGFIAVICICSSVLSGEEHLYTETVWQQSVAIQTEALLVSVSQLVAISVIAIGLCFMVKLLLKIIKNQNEIKSMMK